jgi:Tol biopolymer transport system component
MHAKSKGAAAVLTVWLVSGAAAAASMGSATAKPPHVQDGQLVYGVQDPDIADVAAYTINPDGTHPRKVSDVAMECPHWSPDGTQLASCGAPGPDGGTTLVNVDTGAVQFRPPVAGIASCYVWSNDGTRLACEGLNDNDGSRNGLFTVRFSDWSDVRRVTSVPDGDDIPGDYSPNSKQIVFFRDFAGEDANPALFRINVNGTGQRRLTPTGLIPGSAGSWSPHGNQILFSARVDFDHRQALWLMHADGTNLHPLSIDGLACGASFDNPDSVGCADPTWSPSGQQIAFRINSATGSVVERANADGSRPRFVVDLGLDPGDFVGWGTHPLATTP